MFEKQTPGAVVNHFTVCYGGNNGHARSFDSILTGSLFAKINKAFAKQERAEKVGHQTCPLMVAWHNTSWRIFLWIVVLACCLKSPSYHKFISAMFKKKRIDLHDRGMLLNIRSICNWLLFVRIMRSFSWFFSSCQVWSKYPLLRNPILLRLSVQRNDSMVCPRANFV